MSSLGKNRGVRKISELVVSDGRAVIITDRNINKQTWNNIPHGTIHANPDTGHLFVKVRGSENWERAISDCPPDCQCMEHGGTGPVPDNNIAEKLRLRNLEQRVANLEDTTAGDEAPFYNSQDKADVSTLETRITSLEETLTGLVVTNLGLDDGEKLNIHVLEARVSDLEEIVSSSSFTDPAITEARVTKLEKIITGKTFASMYAIKERATNLEMIVIKRASSSSVGLETIVTRLEKLTAGKISRDFGDVPVGENSIIDVLRLELEEEKLKIDELENRIQELTDLISNMLP